MTDDELIPYAAASLSLALQVVAMGGKPNADAVELHLDDDGLSVMLLAEVGDECATAGFRLSKPMTEEEFYAAWD